jgi:hypothetical protein
MIFNKKDLESLEANFKITIKTKIFKINLTEVIFQVFNQLQINRDNNQSKERIIRNDGYFINFNFIYKNFRVLINYLV